MIYEYLKIFIEMESYFKNASYHAGIVFSAILDLIKKNPTKKKVITGDTHCGTSNPKLSSSINNPRKKIEYIAPFFR